MRSFAHGRPFAQALCAPPYLTKQSEPVNQPQKVIPLFGGEYLLNKGGFTEVSAN
jgi:hypothetical protein